MRIIVLGGCGAMGSEATRDLARTSDFEEIVIADADIEKAKLLADELGGGRVRTVRIDVSDEDALAKTLKGFDVVANATTYHFGLIAMLARLLGIQVEDDFGFAPSTMRYRASHGSEAA